jgi:hypothetical protein
MRFVVACRNGHLADVPWNIWAHTGGASRGKSRCDEPNLQFRSRNSKGTTGLATLEVSCVTCKSSRSLSGITAKDSLEKLGLSCLGTQPWQQNSATRDCKETPRVLQRGASNLYFAQTISALEIPGRADLEAFGTTRSAIEANPIFATIERLPKDARNGPVYDKLLGMLLAELEEIEITDVEAVLNGPKEEATRSESDGDFSGREWLALRTPQNEESASHDFITRRSPLLMGTPSNVLESKLDEAFERIVLVTKLKEIRVLRSFSRIEPEAPSVRPDLSDASKHPRIDWLPAIEVYGEGIFLAFNENAIARWEASNAVTARFAALNRRLETSELGGSIVRQRLGGETLTPRFVLLHTFAHLLIRELCFECGYSSAALRERIYARNGEASPQAGVLIYTAAGDSEGTLGGIVRQGEPPRLARSILKAIQSGIWCSADPICRESDGQGYDKTNLAACHACCLLPETSCICGNMLLDRSLLVEPGPQRSGFFIDPAALA